MALVNQKAKPQQGQSFWIISATICLPCRFMRVDSCLYCMGIAEMKYVKHALAALAIGWGIAAMPAQAQETGYTLNGQPVPQDMAMQMYMNGLPPGAYQFDEYGNFGMVGAEPFINADGGPVRYSGPKITDMQGGMFGEQPSQPQQPTSPGGYGMGGNTGGNGIEGTRIFWIYSPSIFSEARGGASGYIHLCSGGVFHRSSEGSFSVGGEYNSQTQSNDPWAGGAGTSRGSGQWQVQGTSVMLYDHDGGQQTIPLQYLNQGSWKIGQHKYASERGRASC